MRTLFVAVAGAIVFSLPSVAVAANSAQTAAGGVVTITSTGSGPNLTYQPSPSVAVEIVTSSTAYTIGTYNSVTTTDNGIEYATTNSASGYAQRTLTATPLSDIGSTAGTLDGADWVWMGGS